MKRTDREYRTLTIQRRERQEGEEKDYKVRGYASTFEPYVLWEDGGIEYKEQIDPKAFDEADMTDVIFVYNHEGMVFARIKNGTLSVSTDEHGLYVEADLGATQQGRDLFDAIDSGLIDQMSFAFTVKEDSYDRETHIRKILKIKKVYDVSAVSIPANPSTDIAVARDLIHGEMEKEKAERLEREKAIEVAKAKYFYMEV